MGFLEPLIALFVVMVGLFAIAKLGAFVMEAHRRVTDRAAEVRRQRALEESGGALSPWRSLVIGGSGLRGLFLGPTVLGVAITPIIVSSPPVLQANRSDIRLTAEGFSLTIFLVFVFVVATIVTASSVLARRSVERSAAALVPRAAKRLARASRRLTIRTLGIALIVNAVLVAAALAVR